MLALAINALRRFENRARVFYALKLPEASVSFNLRGHSAGQAIVKSDGQTHLRLNQTLLAENFHEFIKQTIPHEVAHLVVYWQALGNWPKPKPHGPEWQAVMRDCFSLTPARCHNFRTRPARVVARNFVYTCNCRDHQLTSIMHNKISQRGKAVCKNCQTSLKFVMELNR